MSGIELTSVPGKTFTAVVKDPTDDYAVLESGIAMTEITTGRYRGAYTGTGIVWVQATAGATVSVGFADMDELPANGYAEVIDAIKRTSLTILPISAVDRERQKANTVPLFVGERAETAVTVRAANGGAVDLTGKTLSLEIETQQRLSVASIPITATGSSFSFIPTAPVTSVERSLNWALWDVPGLAVICHGTFNIGYVPVV